MSYQIEEMPVPMGHNLHVWVEFENDLYKLMDAFETMSYVKQFQVIQPMAAHHGRFPVAVFVQVPSAFYAAGIRGKVMSLLGVNREVQH